MFEWWWRGAFNQYFPQLVEETKIKQGALSHILNNSKSELEMAICIATRIVRYSYGRTYPRKKSILNLIDFSREHQSSQDPKVDARNAKIEDKHCFGCGLLQFCDQWLNNGRT